MDQPAEMPPSIPAATFKIGAPSMVYGRDMVKNTRTLANNGSGLKHVELLLFHTPTLHNIPTSQEVQALQEIRDRYHISYSVHLPASFEIASKHRQVRENSISMINAIRRKISTLEPEYYILHIPVTPPTLVSVRGQYYRSSTSQPWKNWMSRALESLEKIQACAGDESQLLVENINYSPKFLEPVVQAGYGMLCLDLGHLLLGDEVVTEVLDRFLDRTREIHLHGVHAFSEHLSLTVLPFKRVAKWISFLNGRNYSGIINLEVFSPGDLNASIGMLAHILSDGHSED